MNADRTTAEATRTDFTAAEDVTYDPAFDPSARSLLHEVEESLAQDDRVDVYLRDVRYHLCVQRAGKCAAS